MQTISHIIASISIEQIGLIIGALTFFAHSMIDWRNALPRPVNLFIVRAASLLIPTATVIATDPNVSAIVHNYFPTLGGFFLGYQGLYHALKAFEAKVESVKTMLHPAEDPQAV